MRVDSRTMINRLLSCTMYVSGFSIDPDYNANVECAKSFFGKTYFFLSEPRGGPEWALTVGGIFNHVLQFRLIPARTGSACKG